MNQEWAITTASLALSLEMWFGLDCLLKTAAAGFIARISHKTINFVDPSEETYRESRVVSQRQPDEAIVSGWDVNRYIQ